MKKCILLVAIATLFSVASFGQAAKQSIGLRGGYGAEISYQHPLGDNNRLELDLGWVYGGFKLAGTYDWTFDLSSKLAPGFAWYVGAGAQVGVWGHGFGIGIAGQIGLEYNFKEVPLQLSIDYRPELTFGGYNYWGNVALGIRYRLK